MKKILVFGLLILMIFGFTGCGATSSPDKVVTGMLDSVKACDIEAMKKYISVDDFASQMNAESLVDSAATMKIFVENLSYKILDTTVNGNTATVNVELTNVDMKPVVTDMISQIFALAFSGVDMTDEQGEAKVLEIFTTSIENHKTQLVTKDAALSLTKGQDGWVIDKPSDDFYDALLGGLITAVGDTNDMFK